MKHKNLTVGYGRQKTKPETKIHIKQLAHVLGVEIVDVDKSDKKEYTPLGCGLYGCAYLVKAIVPEFTGFDRAVIKLTNDVAEAVCFKHLYDKRLWEKTKYLPTIYSCGGPVTMVGFDEIIKHYQIPYSDYNVFWMLREELDDPDLNTKENIWRREYDIVKEITTNTGFVPEDTHSGNWGVRKDGTLVIRDLMCRNESMNLPLPEGDVIDV